jgi:hypothetical protein
MREVGRARVRVWTRGSVAWGIAALVAGCGNSEDTALQSDAGGGASMTAGTSGDAAAAGTATGSGGSNAESAGGSAGSGGGDGTLCPFLPSLGLDLAPRLTATSASPVARPPTVVSTTVLDGSAVIEGELSSTSERRPLVLARQTGCEVGSATQSVNVHAIELVGEGPHRVVFEVSAGAEVVLADVSQSLEGDAGALDLEAPCTHWLASLDEWTGAGYRLVASGLAQGTVFVVATSSGSNERKYTISVSSDTSCSGSAREIVPSAEIGNTPFVDPNPMACTESDLRRCESGVTDPTGGGVEWVDCCLTGFVQNSEGKCGLSGNGSACLERQQPGNPDDSCPAGALRYSFPPRTLGGAGYPCCNWRTGLCGLMNPDDALDLGCSPLAPSGGPANQPCTPDYAAGIVF